jgi:hydroxyethylthiazole kinase-like uncharacterized protein yjeF
MRIAHDVEAVRAAEHRVMSRVCPGALMQRAAAGLAATTANAIGRVYGTRVVLLAGVGDNGGDALYAGALLARRGARVDALLVDAERAHRGGLDAFRQAGGRLATDPEVAAAADVVLDGLVGIGGKGGLRPEAAALLEHVDERALVVAVDLPSGVDADTGEVTGPAVHADLTVTFGTYKPGVLVDPGAAHAGTVVLVDIGLEAADFHALGRSGDPAARAWQAADLRACLPRPTAESDKYSRGVLGVLAGSATYSGAAVLAIGGALHGGAGMVRAVSEPGVAAVVRHAWPEAVVTELDDDTDPRDAGRVQAWVAGPGIGTGSAAARRLDAVLESDVPVLVDADGLTALAERGIWPLDRSAPTLLTPHAGELGRLLGVDRDDIEARRITYVRRAADELGAVVLLKGSTTVICSPGERCVTVNTVGTPALATAGSGDVLSGLVGALLAQGIADADAAAAGAYLHGLAGRLAAAGSPISAGQILAALPSAYERVLAQ